MGASLRWSSMTLLAALCPLAGCGRSEPTQARDDAVPLARANEALPSNADEQPQRKARPPEAVPAARAEAVPPPQVEEQPNDKGQPPTCAFIDLDRVAEGALLEARLLQNTKATWVERNHLERVLREQELQALLSPEGGRQRIQLGKLLKADILVMLRRMAVDKIKALELVVCETRQGLRLSVQSIPVTSNADEGVTILAGHVERSLARRGRRISDICAVPPFVNNDLGYEFDYLKSTFAKLIEQIVLGREELLTVELAEAKEIAREVALADVGARLERRLPLYVLGDYRHEGQGKERRLTIRIQLMRGEQRVAQAVKTDLRPEDAADFVRQAAAELLDKTGAAKPTVVDVSVEARQLAERAATFQKLGNWDEALALIEASLLLKPDQEELRRQAVIVLGKLTRRYLLAPSLRTLEQVKRGEAHYFRGLEHLERFLERAGNLNAYTTSDATNFVRDFFYSAGGTWSTGGGPVASEVIEALAAAQKREREALLRLVVMRARAGREDEATFMGRAVASWGPASLTPREKFTLLLRMIGELQELPGAGKRASQFATHGYTIQILDCPEGQEFLDQLVRIPNKETQEAAAALKKRLEEHRAAAKKTVVPPEKSPASSGPPEILFKPLELTWETSSGGKSIVKVVSICPAGKGIDVISTGRLFLMKEKGKLKLVWSGEGFGPVTDVCYDGRYVWAAVQHYTGTQPPRLVVVDPVSHQVWEFTAEDGLPSFTSDKSGKEVQFLLVAPLAPGTICVAGYFGRTWLALATFDPKAGRKLKIFHEATEVPNREDKEQWKSTRVAFIPTYMFTLTDKPDLQGKIAQRVLLARSCEHVHVMSHPLLIDPEKLAVDVLQDNALWAERPRQNLAVYNGGIYLAGPELMRLGFPDFTATRIQRVYAPNDHDYRKGFPFPRAYYGDKVVFQGNRVHVVGWRWWTTDELGKPFRLLRGDIPEKYDTRTLDIRPLKDRQNWETERIWSISHSNHYGLLVRTVFNTGGRMYQVEFPTNEKP